MGTLEDIEHGMSAASSGHRRKVLVVEDHEMTRMALTVLIGSEPDLVVCGQAATLAQAVELLDTRPDIVLLDLRLGSEDGLALLGQMRWRCLHVPTLVVSSVDPEIFAPRVRAAGAAGFLAKHEVPTRLIETIRRALNGGPVT